MSDLRLQRTEDIIRGGMYYLGNLVADFVTTALGHTPKQRHKPHKRRHKHRPRCGCPHCRGYCPIAMQGKSKIPEA